MLFILKSSRNCLVVTYKAGNPFDQGIITNVLQKLSPCRDAYEFNQYDSVCEVELTCCQNNDEERQAMLDHMA